VVALRRLWPGWVNALIIVKIHGKLLKLDIGETSVRKYMVRRRARAAPCRVASPFRDSTLVMHFTAGSVSEIDSQFAAHDRKFISE
jgi:hypothetical protein